MFLVFLLRLPPSGKKGEQIRGEQETCSHHQLWILWSCRIDVSKFGRYVVSPFPASVVQSHTWILLYIRPTRPSDRSISLFDKNIIHITTVRSYTLKGKQIGIFFSRMTCYVLRRVHAPHHIFKEVLRAMREIPFLFLSSSNQASIMLKCVSFVPHVPIFLQDTHLLRWNSCLSRSLYSFVSTVLFQYLKFYILLKTNDELVQLDAFGSLLL